MLGISKKSPVLWVFVVFVLPVAISWGLYYKHDLLHFKTTNHGVLVAPAIATDVDAPEAGASVNSSATAAVNVIANAKQSWKIVYAPQQCYGEKYEKLTFTLHQLQAVLGQQAHRVRLGILMNACQPNDMHAFQAITLNKAVIAKLKQVMGEQTIQNKIFLIDPLGNLFMYYDADANPMFVLKDIKKVLEVSQIG